MAGDAEAGVDDDGDDGLLDDDADLVAGDEAAVRADGRAERHDGGGADFLEAFGEDGIGVDVREDGESFFDKDFSGLECFDGIGKEVGGIRVDFEFHPLRQACGGGEAGEADGLFGIHGPAGVREEEVFFRVDEFEDVRVGIALAGEIGAAEGHGDDPGAAGGEGIPHGFIGRKLTGAEEETGVEIAAGDGEERHQGVEGRELRISCSESHCSKGS